ncbi:hypothetical protein DJ568_04305 [Mucilaginibacter hurinus]|uniref:Copper-binding protein MbnP-like domain-containing protein n=1 Tax=Mucilaginibacter hurinus TaxID=2201324 RepID=A0A367GRU8_9SPHI|nr:MbnP family protein [Mucilaginibacter hurinus]RCH55980.1 hypothetical protein DJ568_04305 [Mucilaginibacter hurinus]
MKRIFPFIMAGMILTSCSKNDKIEPVNTEVKAPIILEFDNIAGDNNLQLNAGTYINALGEQFTVNTLKYFVSNIKLTNTNGTQYIVPQDSSYFLVDESLPESTDIRLNVPEGDYKTVEFVLGVDSLRSTMDLSKRTGVLDVASGHDGMYWSWASGYIFFKMEGTSPAAPVDGTGQRKFRYHIGGFGSAGSPINNVKIIKIDLQAGGLAKVRKGRESQVHLMADVMKVFNGAPNVSIAANSNVMSGLFSQTVSSNYSNMFTHNHTHN